MTPSTETLAQNQWTVGTFAIARGLTDRLFIATSPWIWISYNTANLHAKWIPVEEGAFRAGLFVSYFESFDAKPLDNGISGATTRCRPPFVCDATPPPGATVINFGRPRYQWKNISTHILASFAWTRDITTYSSLKLSYFWNDDLPYSIRMDPGSDAIRGQIDGTTLTKLRLAKDFQAGIEVGVLGANYIEPYLHLGGSISYLNSNWLLQVGASYTIQFSEIGDKSGWTPGRFDERSHVSQSEGDFYYFRYLQTALHPEVQVQYYF